MAFTTITTTEIEVGKPVTNTTADKIRQNFDDHEGRIGTLETGVGVSYPPLILRVNGPYHIAGATNGILKTTTNFPITITGIRLLIDTAGTSGTTEVDVKYKRGVAAYTTLLTTKPSVSYSTGSDALSTNGVLIGSPSLLAGDIIRLDLTSVQTGGVGFTVRIDYTRT